MRCLINLDFELLNRFYDAKVGHDFIITAKGSLRFNLHNYVRIK